jgi:hypothetical protein
VTGELLAAGLRIEVVEPAPDSLLGPLALPGLPESSAEGLDLILEGFLLHHGRPRLTVPHDRDAALLAGDWCYARGLVQVALAGDLFAIEALAELIAASAALAADERSEGLPELWLATALAIGDGARNGARAGLADAREALVAGDAGPLARLADGAGAMAPLREALAP